jgi:Undecaprenyl-phosphate glucose phosphotransferase
MSLTRRAVVDLVRALQSSGVAPSRRIMIVGAEDKILRSLDRIDAVRDGVEIVSVIALRDQQAYEAEDLALAAAAVRMYRPDDVYLAIPWSRSALLEQCAEAFKSTPAQVHVGFDDMSGLLRQGDVSRVGPMASLRLTRPPMSRIQQMEKRAFDILFALGALVALSPLLLLVAALIRLDSKGPVLFRQTRYGFNQEPFRIFKFRSMRTMEDGAKIRMVTKDDPRVTRVGAFLRRSSIDELPQLLNVLSGEMSIVGPRPHALSHDQRYVERLSRYTRRHNVKPGITGWAQVHGYRGEIRNDGDMQNRLEYDLFYVDNWSLALDIKTVFLTIFSKKTRENAY